MTFTYVALLSGLVAWNLPGGADSIMSRISVSSGIVVYVASAVCERVRVEAACVSKRP